MKRFHSLKKNSEFQAVYRQGRSYANKYLVMYVLDTDRKGARIGISVSKKVGNSVVRHRFARLVRESFRLTKTCWRMEKTSLWLRGPRPETKNSTKLKVRFCTYADFITF